MTDFYTAQDLIANIGILTKESVADVLENQMTFPEKKKYYDEFMKLVNKKTTLPISVQNEMIAKTPWNITSPEAKKLASAMAAALLRAMKRAGIRAT